MRGRFMPASTFYEIGLAETYDLYNTKLEVSESYSSNSQQRLALRLANQNFNRFSGHGLPWPRPGQRGYVNVSKLFSSSAMNPRIVRYTLS